MPRAKTKTAQSIARRSVRASRLQKTENDLTRRRFLFGAGGLLLLGAAGCGGGSSGDSGDEATSAQTVTIEHKFGTAEIEGVPQRVVAVGFNEADFVLAAGVVPVGVREFLGDFPEEDREWAQDALGGAEPELVGGNEINFEAVAALEPDLILGIYSFMTQDNYDLLADIAPTVAQTDEYPDGGTPWQEQMLLTGRALGREERAQEVVDEVEGRFTEEREANPDFEDSTLAIAFYFDGAFSSLGPDDLRTQFFTLLGFELPEETGEISAERLDLLDEDILVVLGTDEATLQDDEVFQNLAVVQEGRTVYFGGFETPFAVALGYSSPLSFPFALDIAVPQLADALAQDAPASEETTG